MISAGLPILSGTSSCCKRSPSAVSTGNWKTAKQLPALYAKQLVYNQFSKEDFSFYHFSKHFFCQKLPGHLPCDILQLGAGWHSFLLLFHFNNISLRIKGKVAAQLLVDYWTGVDYWTCVGNKTSVKLWTSALQCGLVCGAILHTITCGLVEYYICVK